MSSKQRYQNLKETNVFFRQFQREKRNQLLQTLLILMGLIIAGTHSSNSVSFPPFYYFIFFIFIISTLFLYSDAILLKCSNADVFLVEQVLAASFSYVVMFSFAYYEVFKTHSFYFTLLYIPMTIILGLTLAYNKPYGMIAAKRERILHQIFALFYITIIYVYGYHELSKYMEPASALSLDIIITFT